MKFYETLVVENICLDDYDNINKSNPLQAVYKIFQSEYGHEILRKGERRAFTEWLKGLPTALTVPFMNDEILNRAYLHGAIEVNATEEDEDKFLDEYFSKVTESFFNLLNS